MVILRSQNKITDFLMILTWACPSTKNTRKTKNYFKAQKNSEIIIFPGRILPCKQNKSAIYSNLHHVLYSEIKAIAGNWCLIARTWGDTAGTLIVFQRWADGINMLPNAVGTFSRPLVSV